MKVLVRSFFRGVRAVLGPIMLMRERLTAPAGVVRDAQAQAAVDRACAGLALYQFRTCPFCIKVRQEMRRLSLPIEQRDAQLDPVHKAALLAGGGKPKVPCLRIEEGDGQVRWLYESDAIKTYLAQRFAGADGSRG